MHTGAESLIWRCASSCRLRTAPVWLRCPGSLSTLDLSQYSVFSLTSPLTPQHLIEQSLCIYIVPVRFSKAFYHSSCPGWQMPWDFDIDLFMGVKNASRTRKVKVVTKRIETKTIVLRQSAPWWQKFKFPFQEQLWWSDMNSKCHYLNKMTVQYHFSPSCSHLLI